MINNSHQVKVVINSDNLWAELNWLDDIYQYEMNGTYYIRTWTTESDTYKHTSIAATQNELIQRNSRNW